MANFVVTLILEPQNKVTAKEPLRLQQYKNWFDY